MPREHAPMIRRNVSRSPHAGGHAQLRPYYGTPPTRTCRIPRRAPRAQRRPLRRSSRSPPPRQRATAGRTPLPREPQAQVRTLQRAPPQTQALAPQQVPLQSQARLPGRRAALPYRASHSHDRLLEFHRIHECLRETRIERQLHVARVVRELRHALACRPRQQRCARPAPAQLPTRRTLGRSARGMSPTAATASGRRCDLNAPPMTNSSTSTTSTPAVSSSVAMPAATAAFASWRARTSCCVSTTDPSGASSTTGLLSRSSTRRALGRQLVGQQHTARLVHDPRL